MDRMFRFSVKALLLFTILLMCLLAGCGRPSSSTSSGVQKQDQSTQKPQEGCLEEGMMQSTSAQRIAYTVSWEAVATDADNNQGKSALHVSALDVASGKLLWQKAPAKISTMYQSSQQLVADGMLYIASSNSQNILVLAVSTRDGHAIWQLEGKGEGVSMINVCAGKLYLNINHSEVRALQASNGKVLWSYINKKVLMSNFIATSKALYAVEEQQLESMTSIHQSVIALGADNGKLLWRKAYGEQKGPWLFSLVANGLAVYVIHPVPSRSSDDPMVPVSSVQALDGESGKVMWTANMPPNMEQINALRVGNTIYLNGQNLLSQNTSLLVALNASDGRQLWQRKHDYNQITVLGEQDLYGYKGYDFGADPQGKKQLCLLDSTTGKDRWCVDSLQPSQFSLSTTQDMVIVEEELQPGPLTLIQNIYGVSKQDGKILWKLPWKNSSASVQTLTLVTVVEGQSFTSLQA